MPMWNSKIGLCGYLSLLLFLFSAVRRRRRCTVTIRYTVITFIYLIFFFFFILRHGHLRHFINLRANEWMRVCWYEFNSVSSFESSTTTSTTTADDTIKLNLLNGIACAGVVCAVHPSRPLSLSVQFYNWHGTRFILFYQWLCDVHVRWQQNAQCIRPIRFIRWFRQFHFDEFVCCSLMNVMNRGFVD